ncbi:hypothetical protein RSOLAG1IB_01958 [Rhizoctonia solani AG-1 IB]|uniref:Uncharacterized protein n=1 Tax=Thanatephorus cucumeris (strain AG1-IB / isolate 7/3/14) TaxID=1108050 RepID=A0A0B7FEB6_THACB|nr:hypothetical protein RSOLAG1IB_01958 [Rhizoctonia solani AG-1 IB]
MSKGGETLPKYESATVTINMETQEEHKFTGKDTFESRWLWMESGGDYEAYDKQWMVWVHSPSGSGPPTH